jgi:hypothetical protein
VVEGAETGDRGQRRGNGGGGDGDEEKGIYKY